jgi:hypothetical protein
VARAPSRSSSATGRRRPSAARCRSARRRTAGSVQHLLPARRRGPRPRRGRSSGPDPRARPSVRIRLPKTAGSRCSRPWPVRFSSKALASGAFVLVPGSAGRLAQTVARMPPDRVAATRRHAAPPRPAVTDALSPGLGQPPPGECDASKMSTAAGVRFSLSTHGDQVGWNSPAYSTVSACMCICQLLLFRSDRNVLWTGC